jgi:ABC-type sugar transport system permease subunit
MMLLVLMLVVSVCMAGMLLRMLLLRRMLLMLLMLRGLRLAMSWFEASEDISMTMDVLVSFWHSHGLLLCFHLALATECFLMFTLAMVDPLMLLRLLSEVFLYCETTAEIK